MIDFMILGLPRSGTTWAANFFTTERAICLHDPLYTRHYSELDALKFGEKKVGVSCTGLFRFPAWVRQHRAKKIILRRPLAEVNDSLAAIGMPPCSEEDFLDLASMPGEHYPFSDLFKPFYARRMCGDLGLPFDEDRHAELVQIEMQPKFSGLSVGAEVTRRLILELQEISRGAE